MRGGLDVMADLEHPGVLEQRPQLLDRQLQRQLAAAVEGQAVRGGMPGITCSIGPVGMGAFMSRRRAMRDLRARNSISSRNGKSFSVSYGLTLSADNAHGSGTLSSSLTSSFDRRALASFSINAWRRFGCLISPAWASNVSR